MRIAMIGPFGLRPNRTMSSRALNLARALVRRHHDVALFMPPWQTPEEADRWWEEAGVILRYSALGPEPLTTGRNLTRDVLAWQPEVVHGFKPKAYSGLALWWLWHFHRRDLLIVLDMDDWEGPGGWNDKALYTPLQKRFFAWQEQWGMNHAHALTVASKALQSIVWSHGVPAPIVHCIPNGSGVRMAGRVLAHEERRELRAALDIAGRPALLVYSRFFEFDPARLVALLVAVKERNPAVVVLFVGESLFASDVAALHHGLAQNDLLSSVIDLGWVEEADLPGLLRAADVALFLMDDTLINRAKCPVKLADLVGAGLPVVAEEVGQVPAYVLNGKSGYLRPSGDVDGLAADVAALLADPQTRAAFGSAARNHYRRTFDWDNLAGKLLSAYETKLQK